MDYRDFPYENAILFCAMAVPPRDEKSKNFPLYICSDVNVLPFILSLNDTLIFTCNTITLIAYPLIFFDEEDALKIDDMPIKDTAYRWFNHQFQPVFALYDTCQNHYPEIVL